MLKGNVVVVEFFLKFVDCHHWFLTQQEIYLEIFTQNHLKENTLNFPLKYFHNELQWTERKEKKLFSLESQIPKYVGMCTQNYKTYKIAYLTVDSFNLLNYFKHYSVAWKTLPFFISHSNMAQESVTESDKENIIAIMNHLNKWIRLTFPSFGSDHPSVFPLRLLQGDSIFNMSFYEWCFTFTFLFLILFHFHFSLFKLYFTFIFNSRFKSTFTFPQVVQEYERAVIFRLGRLLSGGSKGPGGWTFLSHQYHQTTRDSLFCLIGSIFLSLLLNIWVKKSF